MIVFEAGTEKCLFCEQLLTQNDVDSNGDGVTMVDCPECGGQHFTHDLCVALAALLYAVGDREAEESQAREIRRRAVMN